MEPPRSGPSRQEVRGAPPQLPRARARQQEPDAVRFDETVDLLKEGGYPLDLVHKDDPNPRAHQRALAGLARAQQQTGSGSRHTTEPLQHDAKV